MSHYRKWIREFPCAGHEIEKLRFDGSVSRRWGGDQPSYSPPPAPTAVQSASDYTAAMPQIYQTQLQYQPQFAAMSKAIGEQLYPTTSGLQENLAGQANQMMSAGAPQQLQDQWASNMRAQLGSNVSSPIGADAYSTGLMNYQQQYKTLGQNLGLSVAGRQQLTQAPSITEAMGGYNPSQVMGYNANNYGTYMGGLNTAANNAASMYNSRMGMYGQLGSGLTSSMGDVMGYGLGQQVGIFGK